MFYSKITGGFYSREIHGDNIPADAVEITKAEHAALIEGQSNGKRIVADANGRPILQDPPPFVPPIPSVVTMRQGRLALLAAGKLDMVEAAIAAIDDPVQRRAAEIEWEYATSIDRASPFVQQLAAGLGLSDDDLDALFTHAATL